MPRPPPDVSVLIPTRNGARTLPEVLERVFHQRCDLSYEVVVVDSASTDGTPELARRHPVRLHGIRSEDFSHSRTRNDAAALASGRRYLVFLNQDAVPTDERWLAQLVASIESVPGLKAVSAAEVVRDARRPYVSGASSYAFKSLDARRVHVIEPHVLDRNAHLPRAAQRALFPFSTVCALFDRAHFMAHPFDERLEFGEDLGWAVENSRAGFASACTSLARVFHHHDYAPAELRAIMERTALLYRQVFGWECTADELLAEATPAPTPREPRLAALGRALRRSLSALPLAPGSRRAARGR